MRRHHRLLLRRVALHGLLRRVGGLGRVLRRRLLLLVHLLLRVHGGLLLVHGWLLLRHRRSLLRRHVVAVGLLRGGCIRLLVLLRRHRAPLRHATLSRKEVGIVPLLLRRCLGIHGLGLLLRGVHWLLVLRGGLLRHLL